MTNRMRLTNLVAVFVCGVCFHSYGQWHDVVPRNGCLFWTPAGKPEVNPKELGENWKYDIDAEKLPILRKLANSFRWREEKAKPYGGKQCKALMKALQSGNELKVVEPILRANSVDDDRAFPYMTCRDPNRWEGVMPKPGERPYIGSGLPPFHIFEVTAGLRSKEKRFIILSRNTYNNFSHTYEEVDLDDCSVQFEAGARDTGSCDRPLDSPAPISAMATFKGSPYIFNFTPNDELKFNSFQIESATASQTFRVCRWLAKERLSFEQKPLKSSSN